MSISRPVGARWCRGCLGNPILADNLALSQPGIFGLPTALNFDDGEFAVLGLVLLTFILFNNNL